MGFLERADQGTLQQSETQNNNPVDRSSSGANSIYEQLSSPHGVTGSSLNFSELGELKISSMQNFVSKNIAGPVDPDAPTRSPPYPYDPDAPTRLPNSWGLDPDPNAPPITPNEPIELKTDKNPDIDPSDLNSPYGSKKESKGSLSGQEGFTENRRVEEHILDLEKLMKVQINQDSGFASP